MLLSYHQGTAVISGQKKVSYGELLANILEVSKKLDIEARDRVVVYAPNSPQWVYALYAVWHKEGIPVPVDASLSAGELAYIIEDASPAAIVCARENKAVVVEALGAGKNSPPIEVMEDWEPASQVSEEEIRHVQIPAHTEKERIALIMYTSGTTGNPKGVMISFENLLFNKKCLVDVGLMSPSDRQICLLPLHHILPLQGTLIIPLGLGGSTIFVNSLEKEEIFKTLQEHHATMFIAVPRLYELFHQGLMAKVRQSLVGRILFRISRVLGGLRFGALVFGKVHRTFGGKVHTYVSGGARLEPEISRDLRALGMNIIEGYGTTETAPMVSFTHPGKVKIGSVGFPLAGTDVRTIDGEITVAGPNVMLGYYNKPEATARVLKKGRYYTGDLGELDSDGYLRLTGRKDEMIVLPNGKNINPEEIEQRLLDISPLVKEVGIVQNDGQLVAFVFPDFASLQVDDLLKALEAVKNKVIDRYNAAVAGYRKIFNVRVVKEAFPRTRLGKLKRFKLQEMLASDEQELDAIEEPDFPEYIMVRDFLSRLKDKDVYHFFNIEYDLAMDSLDRVELLAYIERSFGIPMTEKELLGFPTVAELAEFLVTAKTRLEEGETDWAELLRQPSQFEIPEEAPKLFMEKRLKQTAARRFQLSFDGLENIPEGPAILAANHESYLDVPMLLAALPRETVNQTFYWVKKSRFMARVVKMLAGGKNIILVDMEHDIMGVMKDSAQVLRNDRKLLIFPEGTRTADGSMGHFKKSFAILARELQIPIVPIAIKGGYQIMPRRRVFPKKGPIRVEFCKAILPDEKTSYSETVRQVRDTIQERWQAIELVDKRKT